MVLEKTYQPVTIDAQLRYRPERELYDLRFRALGSPCAIQFTASSREQAASFTRQAIEWTGRFEAKYSRFRDSSLISEINRNAGVSWTDIDPEVESIFALCDDLHFMTQGVLDPTMLPLIALWDHRTRHDSLPSEEAIAGARDRVGWKKVERRPGSVFLPESGMALDFGGFGKEYAVDKVAAIAVGCGIKDCLVDFGRDIHALGSPPNYPAWHVGLENPEKPGATWGSLAAVNLGIATSGDYRSFFEHAGTRYGHILDPRTGRPVINGVLSVTVVANSCLEAGVLSTAAFVMGEDSGLELVEGAFGAEGCIVMSAGARQTSKFYEYVAQN